MFNKVLVRFPVLLVLIMTISTINFLPMNVDAANMEHMDNYYLTSFHNDFLGEEKSLASTYGDESFVIKDKPKAEHNGFILPVDDVVGANFYGIVMPLANPDYNSFIAPITPVEAVSKAISSRADLLKIGNDPDYPLNGKYHLTANIDLSTAAWIPIGNNNNPFTGIFDGQGYIIYNLFITAIRQYAGLFGYISNAEIKNVGLDGAASARISISPNGSYSIYAGSISGYATGNSNIVNCFSSMRVGVNQSNWGGIQTFSGGISGYLSDSSKVIDSYNTGTISSSFYSGGISGYMSNRASINNCYNSGSVVGVSYLGGVSGYCIGNGNIANSFNSGNILHASSIWANVGTGGICGMASGNFQLKNCYNTGDISVSDDFLHESPSVGGICGFYESNATIENCFNNGGILGLRAGGICGHFESSATIDNCHNTGKISSAATYSTTSDDSNPCAGGITAYISPNSNFIRNCYNTGDVLASTSVDTNYLFAGGIFADNNRTGTGFTSVINCYNTGNISASITESSQAYPSYAGGIGACREISTKRIYINNCYNDGVIEATDTNRANSVNSSMSSRCYAGGIISCQGTSEIYIESSYNKGTVEATSSDSSYAGGICSYIHGTYTIDNCSNSGDVSVSVTSTTSTRTSCAGGIIGESCLNGSLNNCYNDGDVTVANSSPPNPNVSNPITAGGIIGSIGSELISYNNDGNISIDNCNNAGNIFADSSLIDSYAGGICGAVIGLTSGSRTLSVTVKNSQNLGNINASSQTNSFSGGICGSVAGSAYITYTELYVDINNCFNGGKIEASSQMVHAGGICGRISAPNNSFIGSINNCYNTGNISSIATSSSYAGGICGLFRVNYNNASGNINNCYSAGTVFASSTSSSFAGGICGSAVSSNYVNISACASLSTNIQAEGTTTNRNMISSGGIKTNNIAVSSTGTGIVWDVDRVVTINEACDTLTYIGMGWDFDAVWCRAHPKNNQFPILKVFCDDCVHSITLNKQNLTLSLGHSEELIATIIPSTALLRDVIWSSEDESTAKVENGIVTAVKEGKTIITAKTVDGGHTASCIVTVLLAFLDESIPICIVGREYSYAIRTISSAPIEWSISSGNLPPGLSLNASTGIIRGTPTRPGLFHITAMATIFVGSQTKNFLLDVKTIFDVYTIIVLNKETLEPIAGAVVNIDGIDYQANDFGVLYYDGASGTKEVSVSANGFKDDVQSYNIMSGYQRTIFMELNPMAT